MKKRYQLIFSIILLLIGLSGISFFVILSLSKEDMSKWVAALLLSMFMIFYSINDIVDYKTNESIMERLLKMKKQSIMFILGVVILLIGIILGIFINIYFGYIICGISVLWMLYWLIKGDKNEKE